MSDVVEFLECMGRDARLLAASPEEVQLALDAAGVPQGLQSAVVSGDAAQLRSLLQKPLQCAWLIPGEEQQEDEGEGEEEDAPEDGTQAHRLASVIAE